MRSVTLDTNDAIGELQTTIQQIRGGIVKLIPRCIVVMAVTLLYCTLTLQAQSSAQQVLTFEVKPITSIKVSASPQPMIVDRNELGSGTVSLQDDNTRYSILTNQHNTKIVASIDDPMPEGTRLLLAAGSSIGTSNGTVDLSDATAPVEMVSGIKRGIDRNQYLSYVLVADASVQRLDRQSRLVTLTITN